MAMIIDQRAQLLQSLGSIATSAADAATEGIAEAVKTDSKTVDTALKLFGGFDRSEFENINGQAPNLLTPAVRPPASYEAPSEYFKPLSNTMSSQSLLVPAKDLLQQLEDPRFRMADGLSGFSDNRITQTLAQNKVSMNITPSGEVSLGRRNENVIASLDAFGKLYMMEKTVGTQLQLHEQLDLGVFDGRFSAPKPPLPTADSPKLNQGLKGLPDAQALTPQNIQNHRMLNLAALDHALKGTPETVGEMIQMVDVMMDELGWKWEEIANPYIEAALIAFHNLRYDCELVPPNTQPDELLLDRFVRIRHAVTAEFHLLP